MELNENNVLLEVPQVVKPFKGLIAFSLNKDEWAQAEKFFEGAEGKNLQLKIKRLVLDTIKDNNLGGGVCCGGKVEAQV